MPNQRAAVAGCSPNAQRGGRPVLIGHKPAAPNNWECPLGECNGRFCVCKGASIISRPSFQAAAAADAPGPRHRAQWPPISTGSPSPQRGNAHPKPRPRLRAREAPRVSQPSQEASRREEAEPASSRSLLHTSARPGGRPLCRPSIDLVWDRFDTPQASIGGFPGLKRAGGPIGRENAPPHWPLRLRRENEESRSRRRRAAGAKGRGACHGRGGVKGALSACGPVI